MKQKSLKFNAIWNFIYTGTNILFPLITAPYVSRVLGATNLGQVDFAKSFVQWFVIFASFGITTYGVRAISQARDKKEEMSKVFSELFLINLIFSISSLVIYLLFIFNSVSFSDEAPLFIVMSFSIVLNAVNIDWFYQGIEEYNYITIRNFIIKIISLIFIFIFIRTPDDYVLYGLLSVLGVGLSGVLNVINSRKYVKISFQNIEIKKHLKPLNTFFLITFVIGLYTNLDSTLLGFLSVPSSVAYLTRAKSVTTMGGTVANSITSVAMPRASYYLKHDFKEYRKFIQEIPKYMMILNIPMAAGIAMLSPEIMYILGGEDFLTASNLLTVISVVVILSSLSSFLQHQILVPSGNEKFGLVSSIISSIVSIIANIVLISRYDYMGAGLALVLAELAAVISRYTFIKIKGYNFIKLLNKSTIKYIFASSAMVLPIYVMKQIFNSVIYTFVLSAISGALTYFIVLLLLKEELTIKYSKEIISRIKKSDNYDAKLFDKF